MLDVSKLTVAQLLSLTRLELPADTVEVDAEYAEFAVYMQVLTETCDFDIAITRDGAVTRTAYPQEVGGSPTVTVTQPFRA